MTSGVDKGKFLALEDISCRIKEGCKDHPPWPKGICSRCQPNAITLNRQVFILKIYYFCDYTYIYLFKYGYLKQQLILACSEIVSFISQQSNEFIVLSILYN